MAVNFQMVSFSFSKQLCTLCAFNLAMLGYTLPSLGQHDASLLKAELSKEVAEQTSLAELDLDDTSLTSRNADEIEKLVWKAYSTQQKANRLEEHKSGVLTHGELKMPFYFRVNGEKPDLGRSLFISLHGGGGAPKQVNDQQWENQKRLYDPKEGVYLVPRAPTNTWNLWHQGHIDPLFQRLIENMVLFENVNPNRVYVMGYSAGGDGVYQIGPRMADRWAGAAMMAGHPNDSTPESLRNTAFTLHMGANDSAYNRNKVAAQWETLLADLQQGDPQGYTHSVKIHEGKGHWMDREDRVAVPWMAKHTRNPLPNRIVWKQDDVTHNRFYWLAVNNKNRQGRTTTIVERDGQHFNIERCDLQELTIRLNDNLCDLNKRITVSYQGHQIFKGKVSRSSELIQRTTLERGDYTSIFSAEINLAIPSK